MIRRHPVLTVFTLGYLAVVAWATLGPQPLDTQAKGLLFRALRFAEGHQATSWITFSRVEFGANIVMFLPIGLFLLLLIGRRFWWLALALGVALTIGIETAQLFIPGRVSDLRDVASNSIGAALGVAIAAIVTARGEREHRRRRTGLVTDPSVDRPLTPR